MCGRITRTSPREAIAKEFGVTRFAEVEWHPRYNVAPSQIVETIISIDSEKRLGPMRWGFVSPQPRSFWTGQIKRRRTGRVKTPPVAPSGWWSTSSKLRSWHIFREHAVGYSLAKMAHRLNAGGVAPPLHGTRHGQNRKAWSVSSIHAMLRNRRYFGEHSWNARQYKKDAKSGKRRARLRTTGKRRVEERPRTTRGTRPDAPGHRSRPTRSATCSPASSNAGRAEPARSCTRRSRRSGADRASWFYCR